MLDVVPPGPGGVPKRRSKRIPSRANAVEVDWRLPARLRRPVHIELARQRKRQRQREAIVRFERKPLYPPTSAKPQSNRGAEHHTGDVYKENRPRVATPVPPYAGSFLRGRPVQPVAQQPQRQQRRPHSKPVPAKKMAVPLLSGERDVPYQWTASQQRETIPVTVAAPRHKRFALPLHFSIWPFKNGARQSAPTSKKKVQNTDSLTL